MIGGYSSENSSNTQGPFSDMVRSLVVLNLSLGSASTCFFFELTEAEGLFLSLCRVMGTPIGNEMAGRRHELVSALLRDVLY